MEMPKKPSNLLAICSAWSLEPRLHINSFYLVVTREDLHKSLRAVMTLVVWTQDIA